MNRHARRAAKAQQQRQNRAVQIPLDDIARRLEKEMGFKPGRLRLSITPLNATQMQYQLFAKPRVEEDEITRINELLSAELAKFSQARSETVDPKGTVVAP